MATLSSNALFWVAICFSGSQCLYFTLVPSVFQFDENLAPARLNYTNYTINEPPFKTELLQLAQRVVSEHYTNSYQCKLQETLNPVRCLMGRELPVYIFPYDCLLTYTRPADDDDLMIEFMPASFDPATGSNAIGVPIVFDPPIVALKGDNSSLEASKTRILENGNQSCPCNCKVDCQSLAKLRLIRGKTSCGDCKCLLEDIGCDCLDSYDLDLGRADDHIVKFLAFHPLYRIPSDEIFEPPEDTTPSVRDEH